AAHLAFAQIRTGGHGLRMLSWDDFRYVKAIADTRTLGGAAQELSVNHSTVFRRLAQIESQLGSRLFERSRGGYALTPCGEEMVRPARRPGGGHRGVETRGAGPGPRPPGGRGAAPP